MSDVVQAAAKIIKACQEKFEKDFGKKVIIAKITASNKMTRSWGLAVIDGASKARGIKLSNQVFSGKTHTEAFRDTVIHEFCHHAANRVNGSWGHDATWKRLMMHFGLEPNRLVTAEFQKEIDRPRVRRTVKRYEHKCTCKTHSVGGKVHNKIQAGAVYTCRLCGSKLKKSI